jgi:hypothetical protein
MTRLEAIKIANILMDNYKMPVARRGVFSSYVTNRDGRDLLYIGAGGLGLYIDVESLEIVEKIKRQTSTVEEFASEETFALTPLSYEPEDYQD